MPAPLEQYDLLIVSDLHLSEGRSPQTKKFSPNEDFFFDEEFGRFLAYYQDETRWPGRKWHLIINGDFLDFLQVTAYEGAPPELLQDVKRPEYGLGCGEQETVYKLGKIMEGHWQFFEALADFIAAGNILSISKGNHDVEFHYQALRTAFRDELRAVYEKKLEREADPDRAVKLARLNDESIRFLDWFYYEKGLLWVEHGNQYDELNNFKYWLSPLLPDLPKPDPKRQDDIDLPWGSLFVRYLFNRVETEEPFADNIKPQTKFIGWFLRHHPLQALMFLYGDGRYMLAKMRRAWQPVPPKAYASRATDHDGQLGQLAEEWKVSEVDLDYLDNLRAHSVLKETRGRWLVFRWLVRHRMLLPLCTLFLYLLLVAAWWLVRFLLSPLLPDYIRWLLSRLHNLAGQFIDWLFGTWLFKHVVGSVITHVLLLILASLGKILASLGKRRRPTLVERAHEVDLQRRGRSPAKKEFSPLALRSPLISERLKVKYVIMGHTHDPDLQSIGQNGEEYFNTGTWTKVFSAAERLIREENELAYVQALRREDVVQVKLLKWHDAAGAPRLVKLFDRRKTR